MKGSLYRLIIIGQPEGFKSSGQEHVRNHTQTEEIGTWASLKHTDFLFTWVQNFYLPYNSLVLLFTRKQFNTSIYQRTVQFFYLPEYSLVFLFNRDQFSTSIYQRTVQYFYFPKRTVQYNSIQQSTVTCFYLPKNSLLLLFTR